MTPSKGPFHVETDEKGHTERKTWTPVVSEHFPRLQRVPSEVSFHYKKH